MFVLTGLNFIGGILNGIQYYQIGSVSNGIGLILVGIISLVHALIFRAYINKYKETYNIKVLSEDFTRPDAEKKV